MRVHCRSLLWHGRRHHFVLTKAEEKAASAAYCIPETQCKVSRLEKEKRRSPPSLPLTPTERSVTWEDARGWLHELPAELDLFSDSGCFVVGKGFVPKAAALAYEQSVAGASELLVGSPKSDSYTYGVKLFCLRDAVIFAPVQVLRRSDQAAVHPLPRRSAEGTL